MRRPNPRCARLVRLTRLTRWSHLTHLILLCAGLVACAPFVQRADERLAQADSAYRFGRAQHLAGRPAAARAAYATALQAAPGHAGARNGLAALHAEGGALAPALAIWRDLTALAAGAAGPDKAYLFVNLGHAHLLAGEHASARAALERACLLAPLNARAWALLGQSLDALGQGARARQMLQQAAALRQHDLRADFAAAGGQTGVAALARAMAPPAAAGPDSLSTQPQLVLHVGADGMLTLRRLPAPQQALPPAAPHVDVARLEISNGNGVTGMARALARRIAEPGVQVTRLSNQPGFAVRHTRIEYEAAHVDAALRLAQRFGSAQLRQLEPGPAADLRLVLGHDLARPGASAGRSAALAYR